MVGIFESGMYEYDTSMAYVSMKNAQSFLKMADDATGMEVKVTDIYQARSFAEAMRKKLGDTLPGAGLEGYAPQPVFGPEA